MPAVSVIIAVYNGESYICEAIDSALNQTLEGTEVIVVDDGSTDSTPALLAEYGDGIKALRQQNAGQSSATNLGLASATGKYIALLNADDAACEERFEIEAAYLDAHPDVALVYTDRFDVDDERNVLGVRSSGPTDRFDLLFTNIITESSIMLRRSCLDVIGTFSERTVSTRTDGLAADNGDWDMWIRIAEQFPIAHLGQPLIRYRLHEGQGTLTLTGDHVRLSKHLLRIDSLRRRGGPLWLRLMVARTWSQVMLGHLPVIGGRFSLMWHRLDRVLDLIEKRVIRALFRDAVYR